jgi:hypothetical protein
MAAARGRLDALEREIEKSRADASAAHDEAFRETRRMLEEGEQKAAAIVNDAKAVAARVRADSERELAAATQRRDSINAQLANVRQMLTTLTGGAPGALMSQVLGEQVEASEPEAAADEPADPEPGPEADATDTETESESETEADAGAAPMEAAAAETEDDEPEDQAAEEGFTPLTPPRVR